MAYSGICFVSGDERDDNWFLHRDFVKTMKIKFSRLGDTRFCGYESIVGWLHSKDQHELADEVEKEGEATFEWMDGELKRREKEREENKTEARVPSVVDDPEKISTDIVRPEQSLIEKIKECYKKRKL